MAWSAPTFLAEDANDSVAAASVVLTGITASVGALVVLTGRFDSGGGGITGFTVTDSAGNTWGVFHNGIGNSNRELIASSVLTTALSAGNITVARTGTTNITSYAMQASSFTGAATGTWEDTAVRSFASGNGYSTTVTGGTAANAGDLVISSLGYNLAGGGMSFTEASGWTTARTTTATNKWNNQAYKVNSGTSGLVYTPSPSGGAPGGSSYTLLQTAFIAASGGGNPTFSMSGSGTAQALAASAAALTGVGTMSALAASAATMGGVGVLSPSAASVMQAAGAGTATALAASALSAAGLGSLSIQSVMSLSAIGVGTFNALPGSLFPAFTMAGAGSPTLRAAMTLATNGVGAFNPTPFFGSVPFTMNGTGTVSFLGSVFKWDRVPATSATWTPDSATASVWTPETSPSTIWTRRH